MFSLSDLYLASAILLPQEASGSSAANRPLPFIKRSIKRTMALIISKILSDMEARGGVRRPKLQSDFAPWDTK
jgi:hypothetical protein